MNVLLRRIKPGVAGPTYQEETQSNYNSHYDVWLLNVSIHFTKLFQHKLQHCRWEHFVIVWEFILLLRLGVSVHGFTLISNATANEKNSKILPYPFKCTGSLLYGLKGIFIRYGNQLNVRVWFLCIWQRPPWLSLA